MSSILPRGTDSKSDQPDICPVCDKAVGGKHGTPAMSHDCSHPGCVFGPMHTAQYHLVDGQRVAVGAVARG